MTSVAAARSSVLQESLQTDIASVRERLEALARGEDVQETPFAPRATTLRAACSTFGLSSFEGQLLLLGAAVELDQEVASLCGRLNHPDGRGIATFALASHVLPEPHWSALLPTAPLRYWRLMEVEPRRDGAMVQAPMRISERALHHLAGLEYLDESLHGWLRACPPPSELWPAHGLVADRLTRHLSAGIDGALFLTGADELSRREVAARACAGASMRLYVLRGEDVPAEPGDRDRLSRLWTREALFSPAVLLIEGGQPETVAALTDRIGTALVVSADEAIRGGSRPFVRMTLAPPTATERRAWWRAALGARADTFAGGLDALAVQFELTPGQIVSVIESSQEGSSAALWQACRLQARPAFGDLAQRVEPSASWDDLVLPAPQADLLRQIVTHVRHRLTVHEEWGFGAASRGLGISALFSGASGTGKTMAGEVLARELDLDLYRIDLSQVVSKYIGETEKNLSRVFDEAERSAVILLFDEADALFGKRSEVKDSHDRYANIEVSYLLQRMEAYHGLAILTTNMRASLDPAFLRRLRFVVEFPFPDAAARAEIWRRIFPPSTPTEGLAADKLARLSAAGGNIRNIAVGAAFLAAAAGRPIRAGDVLHAARTECAKIGKALGDAEIRDWV